MKLFISETLAECVDVVLLLRVYVISNFLHSRSKARHPVGAQTYSCNFCFAKEAFGCSVRGNQASKKQSRYWRVNCQVGCVAFQRWIGGEKSDRDGRELIVKQVTDTQRVEILPWRLRKEFEALQACRCSCLNMLEFLLQMAALFAYTPDVRAIFEARGR